MRARLAYPAASDAFPGELLRSIDAFFDTLRLRLLNTPPALPDAAGLVPDWKPEQPFARPPVPAAVLIALIRRPEGLTVLYTERSPDLRAHSGQVAFPGGKRDPEDADATATALREAQEEVGLDPALVEVLGSLPPYVTTTGFVVTPVVGLVPAEAHYQPNPYEVADLFEVPLAFLLDPANHQRHALDRPEGRREWLSMPYQDGPTQRYIWGATAGMLRNFYRFMQA